MFYGKKKAVVVLMAVMLSIMLVVAGCGTDDAPVNGEERIDLGYVQWACAEAQTHVAQAVIMDRLGYDVNVTALEVAPVFSGVAEGDLDAFLAAWLPVTHEDYMDQYGDQVDDYGHDFEGARIGLIVPQYVDINSIEELNDYKDEFNGRITGIDGGAGIMRTTETAIEEYDLDMELMESSDMAMTAALADAFLDEEWIVVTGWTPHWKFAEYELKFLEDPKGLYGDIENIHVIARQGFDTDVPEVADFLKNYMLTEEELGAVMGYIADGQAPLDAARQWISENEAVVDGWLQ